MRLRTIFPPDAAPVRILSRTSHLFNFWLTCLLLLPLLGWLAPRSVSAQEGLQNLPPDLAPYVPWMEARHPTLHCPLVDGNPSCLWPGGLELNLSAAGGAFSLSVQVDQTRDVPLPGNAGAWPQNVKVDGQLQPVIQGENGPEVRLSRGAHRVTGLFQWNNLPGSLQVSPLTGLVRLTVDGKPVSRPQLGGDGLLRLSAGEAKGQEEDRLDIDVLRRIEDGMPTLILTRIQLRASGTAREVPLGQVLLPQTRPVSLEADLPARLSETGTLVVQLRPGTYSVTVGALLEGPLATLTAPSLPAPWPANEFWVVKQDEAIRSTQLGGATGIDPARVPLPEDWKGLPTFMLNPGEKLEVTELRRGMTDAPPNKLQLSRTLWLDLDGDGFTTRDQFSGEMNQDWRLNLLAPAELGRIADHDENQVITRSPEGKLAGAELRGSDVNLIAESRINQGVRTMSAVGWDRAVSSLDLRLHLPPGWKLFAVSGADVSADAMIDEWTLFDLFFVLIVAMAAMKLAGRSVGALALAGLVLTRHLEDTPEWSWVFLLVLLALLRVAPEGWWKKGLAGLRWLTVVTLLILLATFSLDHLRNGIFPVLEKSWQGAQNAGDILNLDQVTSYGGRGGGEYNLESIDDRFVQTIVRKEEKAGAKFSANYQKVLQQDPAAQVQTGPGLPTWSWNSHALRWVGPVTPEEELHFWLLSPLMNGILAFLRVGLLVMLVIRLGFLDFPMREKLSQLLPPRGSQGGSTPGSGGISTGGLATGVGQAMLLVGLAGGVALGLAGLMPSTAFADEPSPTPSTANVQAQADTKPHGDEAAQEDNQRAALLQELEKRILKPADCQPNCVAVAQMALSVEADALTMVAEVHAATAASWPVPGPASNWRPEHVWVDGQEAVGMARLSDDFLHVRLEPGVHSLRLTGTLPPSGALNLQFGMTPQHGTWSGQGWTLDGLRADGTLASTVQLVRAMTGGDSPTTETRSSENLTPWLEVRRTLELGIPWSVHTEVVRRGSTNSPVSIKVPLLEGESVTESRFQAQGRQMPVVLGRDETSVAWNSTLAPRDVLTLTAPKGVPWIEQWAVACSPIFACSASGVPPLQHLQDGRWFPLWRVWAGESVTINVSKPEAIAGQTLTIERVRFGFTPGERLAEGKLELAVRSSQGGQLPITLPEGAQVQSVTVGSSTLPIKLQQGVLGVPLQPGLTGILVSWQQPYSFDLWSKVPAIGIGAAAVNAEVRVQLSDNRWILALMGPMWGPVPLFWSLVLIVLLAAPFLGRLKLVPLNTRQWALLGLGLVTVPMPLAAVVVLWFIAMGWRRDVRVASWWKFDLLQLFLVGLTLFAMGVLYGAIHIGLLEEAPSRITANLSTNTQLNWYVDRVKDATPSPTIVSLPMWVWRVTMLVWSLWLASSLLRWLPWAWSSLTVEGILRRPEPRARVSGAVPVHASAPVREMGVATPAAAPSPDAAATASEAEASAIAQPESRADEAGKD